MNDFFTELNEEIIGSQKTPVISKIEPIKQKQDIKNETNSPVKKINQRSGEMGDISHSLFGSTLPARFPTTRRTVLPALQKGTTRVMTIGGYNEIGGNMTAYQCGDEILLVGAGIGLQKESMLGIKYSLPDVTFLVPVKHKIIGMVILNGQFENIAGLKYILPALGYPKIYGTKLTIALIKGILEEANVLEKARFHIVNPDTGIFPISSNFRVELFIEQFTLPDAVGAYIETSNMKIVHTGDYKLGVHPSSHDISQYQEATKIDFTQASSSYNSPYFAKLRQMGARKIDLLVSDSIGSMKEGFSKTETEIENEIRTLFTKTNGRIFIAVSPYFLGRIIQIVELAIKTNRTLLIDDRVFAKNISTAQGLGLIPHSSSHIKNVTNKIGSLSVDNQIILTTTGLSNEGSGLCRIVQGEHPTFKIKSGDSVILAGNRDLEKSSKFSNLMNNLIRLGTTLFMKDWMNEQNNHATKEEQKMVVNLIQPKNFVPNQGELFMRVSHKENIESGVYVPENITLVDNGSLVDIDLNGEITKHAFHIPLEEIIVDGRGMGTATSHVLEARTQMMKAGVVTVIFRSDEKSRMLLGHLRIETRGLVYLDEVREVHKMIIKKARASYEDTLKDIPDIEEKDLIKIIRRDLEIFLEQKLERNPLIIPVILSI